MKHPAMEAVILHHQGGRGLSSRQRVSIVRVLRLAQYVAGLLIVRKVMSNSRELTSFRDVYESRDFPPGAVSSRLFLAILLS